MLEELFLERQRDLQTLFKAEEYFCDLIRTFANLGKNFGGSKACFLLIEKL